jgi:hypothetical protein
MERGGHILQQSYKHIQISPENLNTSKVECTDFNEEVHRNKRKLTQGRSHCRRKSGVTDNVTGEKDAAPFSIFNEKSRDGK